MANIARYDPLYLSHLLSFVRLAAIRSWALHLGIVLSACIDKAAFTNLVVALVVLQLKSLKLLLLIG